MSERHTTGSDRWSDGGRLASHSSREGRATSRVCETPPDVRAVRVMMSEFGRDQRCLHRDSAALSVPRPCCALALDAPAVSCTGRALEERQTSSASYGIIPERLWK